MSRFSAFMFIAALVLISPSASAQVISGSAKDLFGHAIPGLEVSVFDAANKQLATTRTNNLGVFRMPAIPKPPLVVSVTFSSLDNIDANGIAREVVPFRLINGRDNQTVNAIVPKRELSTNVIWMMPTQTRRQGLVGKCVHCR
jgi:hypothetical protein